MTQKYIEPIVNGTAKGIYLKLIDDGNNAVRGAEVVVYYKEGDDINHYTVRNSNYSGIVEHYHLRDSNKLIYYAVISAVNYETKIIEVIPKVAGEVPQEVIMTKGDLLYK